MVKLQGNKIELSRSVELSKRQAYRISLLSPDEQKQYALSLMGLSRERIRLDKPHAKNDPLANRKNSVLHRFQDLLDCSADKMHRPLIRKPDSFWVGVEIECLIEGQDESSSECDTCGGSGEMSCYNCEGRGHLTLTDENDHEYRVDCAVCDGSGNEECPDCDGSSSCNGDSIHAKIRRALERAKITNCSVKQDGSLSDDDGRVGVEVTVLFDASHGFDKLQKVCKVLNDFGAVINDTCGLHVHLDQQGKSTGESLSIGKRIGKFLPILSRLVPSSRRRNNYCKLSVSGLDGSRYHAVNMTSLSKHRTIEVRLHSGTTDARKIESWVKLLRAIVESKLRFQGNVSSFQAMIDILRLSDELVEYFDRRFQKFNPLDDARVTASQPETHDDEVEGSETESAEDFRQRLELELQNQQSQNEAA